MLNLITAKFLDMTYFAQESTDIITLILKASFKVSGSKQVDTADKMLEISIKINFKQSYKFLF